MNACPRCSRRFASLAPVVAFLILLLPATPSGAQSWFWGDPDPNDPAYVQAQVAQQSLVRVAGPWGSAILHRPQLDDQALSYDSLTGFTPGTTGSTPLTRPLPFNEVARIERLGNASGSGAAIGGALGAVAGIAVGIGLARASEGPSASFTTGGEVFGGGLAGAMFGCAVGGIVGAVIGSKVPKWHALYTRPSTGAGGAVALR